MTTILEAGERIHKVQVEGLVRRSFVQPPSLPHRVLACGLGKKRISAKVFVLQKLKRSIVVWFGLVWFGLVCG